MGSKEGMGGVGWGDSLIGSLPFRVQDIGYPFIYIERERETERQRERERESSIHMYIYVFCISHALYNIYIHTPPTMAICTLYRPKGLAKIRET